MEKTKQKREWVKIIGLIIIILLAVEDGMLIYQNRQLKVLVNGTSAMMETLKPGDHVEEMKLQMLDGTPFFLQYKEPSKKYLLFVFSTNCPHCEKTVVNWKAISMVNNVEKCAIIGISAQGLKETLKYATTKDLNFLAVSAVSDTSFSRKYKINGVPQTILVQAGAIVQKSWMGELTAEQVKEIEKLMGAS